VVTFGLSLTLTRNRRVLDGYELDEGQVDGVRLHAEIILGGVWDGDRLNDRLLV